jgi:selenocysteine-specific elongation factor
LPDHHLSFTPAQQKKIDELLAKFEQAPFSPPGYAECVQLAGEELIQALIHSGKIYRVNADVLFTATAVEQMSNFIRKRAETPAPFSVAEFRDRFETSRRYALAFLEHLDEIKATRREGDGRLLIHPEKLP